MTTTVPFVVATGADETAAPSPGKPAAKRNIYLIFAAILVIGTVGACSTGAQRHAQAITDNNSASGQQLLSCLKAIYDSPVSEPIRRHMPMDVRTATLEQMTDSSFATDVEIAAILDIHPQAQTCKQTFLDRITQTTPSLVPILASIMTMSESSLIDLIQRKKNWGDHVRQVKDWLPHAQAQLVAEQQRIQAGLNQDHQSELAQRQAAANAMTQFLQTQQMISAINRPVITNCNQFGRTVNCVSQ